MPSKNKSTGILTGTTRVFNIDAVNVVPDSVIFEVEKILSGGDLIISIDWWIKEMAHKMKFTGISFFQIIQSGIIPFDFEKNEIRTVEDIRPLMIMLLRMIPIVSIKSPIVIEQGGWNQQYLGAYFTQGNNPMYGNRPHIEIYTDNIRIQSSNKQSEKEEYDYNRLCTTTIIHELSHAVMDPCNYGMQNKYRNTYEQCYGTTPHKSFYTMREESFANTMMYKTIAKAQKSIADKYQYNSKDKPTNFLLQNIKNQDAEYRIATFWLNKKPNFAGWIRAKATEEINANKIQVWLQAVKNADSQGSYQVQEDKTLPWI